MTINDPVVSNGAISFGLTGVDTALTGNWYVFKDADVIGITGDDPTTITSYEDTYLPLEVTIQTTAEFKFTDLPYISGDLVLFLEDATGWTRKDFDLVNTKRTAGVNFPVTIEPSSEKQPTPVINSQDVKGAPKYYSTFQEFLYMPREHMLPNMLINVYDDETGTIKQFVLNRNGVDLGNGTFGQIDPTGIDALNLPFLKSDITNTRSYQRFFTLISESQEVSPVGGVIRHYAPDYEDGVPPWYDDILASGTPGVTYPVGLSVPSTGAYDKNREFLGLWTWDAPTSQFLNTDAGTTVYFGSKQVTKTQKPGDKWFIESVDGISFTRWKRIGQFDTGSVTQNRYVRRITDVDDPYGILGSGENKFPPTPDSFLDGIRNRFGKYEDDFGQGGTPTELNYTDVPPALRVNQGGLSVDESALYDAYVLDGVSNLDVDGLWEVTCIKDKYNRLESEFSPARYIPTNADLVRYNSQDTPNINEILEANWVANGWVTTFDPAIHRYKAERNNTGEDFSIVLISEEIGTYTARVFKAYPLRYFDALTNASSSDSYAPQGIAAAINPSDGVDDTYTYLDDQLQVQNAPNKGSWVDSWFAPPEGWSLWMSEAVFYFGGDKLKTQWSNATLFDNEAAVIDSITGQQNFQSIPSVDDQGAATVTYEPATIDLVANLTQYSQRSQDEGQQFIINDDPNETIAYKWERIFNNGAADSTIIFDNTASADASELISNGDLVSGAFTYSPGAIDTYRIEDYGRTMRIYPPGLDKRAIYKVTQERTIPGGTVSYVEETQGLLDIADGLASKTIVATTDRSYFVLLGDAVAGGGFWQYDDYTDPVGLTHPEAVLRAFVQNVAEGKWYRWSSGSTFDTVRTDVISGSETKENTLSATYWTEIASTTTHVVQADATEWNDGIINKTVVYKYQSGAYYDLVRLERIQEGASIRSISLKASANAVSYNPGETEFDPLGQIIEFRVIAQNLTTAGINWEILDKTGADISANVVLYDAPSGGSAIVDGDTVGYLRVIDHPSATPALFNDLLNNLPVTIKITHDDYADQVDFQTVRKVLEGGDGPAGTDSIIGYLNNEAELQSCDESGVPIDALFNDINGSLTLSTDVEVLEGVSDVTSSYAIGGASPTVDITAVDEDGNVLTYGTGTTEYYYELSNSNRTITVTRIPEDKQKIIISLPIKRISDYADLVTRKFTISKALAGFTALRINFDNEFVIGKHQPDQTVLDSTTSGLAGYGVIGTVLVKGFLGATEQTITFNGDVNDSIVGYPGASVTPFAAAWPSPGTLGETTARSIRYTDGGNDMYFVLGDSGTIYIVSKTDTVGTDFDYNIAFQEGTQTASQKIAVRWLEQPADQYQVVVYSPDPVFSANESASSYTTVSARVVDKTGTETATIPAGWTMEFSTGSATTTEAGYTATVQITRAQINLSNQIVVKLKDGGGNVISVGSIVLYDLKDAPSFQELFWATNTVGFPSKPSNLIPYLSYPSSIDGQWGRTPDVDRKYLYISRKSEYDDDWGWPIQAKGEEGTQGALSVPLTVYRVDDALPIATGGGLPVTSDYTTFTAPAGWEKTPDYQGINRLWSATRFAKYEAGVWTWEGDWKVALIGSNETLSEVFVYRESTTDSPAWVNDYDAPASVYPQTSGSWKNSIAELIAPEYIFRSRGLVAAGSLQQRILETGVVQIELNASTVELVTTDYRFRDSLGIEITTGATGEAYIFGGDLYIKQGSGLWTLSNSELHYWAIPELIYQQIAGPTGPAGPIPDHEWSGTQLRFQNPNLSWGSYVDLKGDVGATGAQGAAAGLEEVWSSKGNSIYDPSGAFNTWANMVDGSIDSWIEVDLGYVPAAGHTFMVIASSQFNSGNCTYAITDDTTSGILDSGGYLRSKFKDNFRSLGAPQVTTQTIIYSNARRYIQFLINRGGSASTNTFDLTVFRLS